MRSLSVRSLLPKLGTAAFIASLALIIPSDVAPILSSGNFNPTTFLTLTDHTPGANADSTSSFDIAAGQLLGAPVALTPQAATINSSPGTIATGLGDVVGTLTADSTVGLNNGPCNFPVAITATLLSATVDNSAGNLVYPSNPHEAAMEGLLLPFRQDVYVVTPDDIAGNGNDIIGSAGATSVPAGPANGLPSHADRYPAFLNSVFDPDGTGPTHALAPLARYSGSTVVLSKVILIQVVVFSPGALAAYAPPATLSDLSDVSLGYASVVVLNDPTAAPLPDDAITDRCSPLTMTFTLFGITKTNPCAGNGFPPCDTHEFRNAPTPGVATGRVRYANPASTGTYVWNGFHSSERDLDGDGVENSFDTCPYSPNVDGDPRTISGSDGDMIDSACDPNPSVNEGSGDFDGDGFKSAADNCPLIPNPTQAQAESSEPDNIASPRGGSGTDSLGDECDGAETTCGANVDDDGDGLVNDGCPTVGNAVAESSTQCGFSTTAGVDNDFDSYPNDGCPQGGATAESGSDCQDYNNDDSGDDSLVNDGCPAQGGPELGCLNSTDDDVDGTFNDGCPSSSRVANGHYHTILTVKPKCIGGTDADADGWCFSTPGPESGAACQNNADDDKDSVINDGCPAAGPGAPETACADAIDDDSDTFVNDGCDGVGADGEFGAQCANAINDDPEDDSYVNDACPPTGPSVPEAAPECGNAIDEDQDGIINDGCAATNLPLNDPDDAQAAKTPETYSQLRPFAVAHSGSGNNPPASREPLQVCNDGIDNDGDTLTDLLDSLAVGASTLDDCRPPDAIFTSGPDTDGDGSRDAVEIHLGTDALSRCERGLTVNGTTPSKGWPSDLRGETAFNADKLNVGDFGGFISGVRKLGTSPGDAGFDRRWDLRPGTTVGKWIGVSDLAAITTPVPPLMYEVRAFNFGSVCSAHPVYGD